MHNIIVKFIKKLKMALSKPSVSNNIEEMGRSAVSVEKHDKINKVRLLAGKSVCKIHTVNNDQGSGAFYQVYDNNRICHYLIT